MFVQCGDVNSISLGLNDPSSVHCQPLASWPGGSAVSKSVKQLSLARPVRCEDDVDEKESNGPPQPTNDEAGSLLSRGPGTQFGRPIRR